MLKYCFFSVDESYNPDRESASDVDEEYDSNPPTSSGSSSGSSDDEGGKGSGSESVKSDSATEKKRKHKEQKKKAKKPRSAKTVVTKLFLKLFTLSPDLSATIFVIRYHKFQQMCMMAKRYQFDVRKRKYIHSCDVLACH